jgi:hypothetical protein
MASVAQHLRQHPGLAWLGVVAVMAAVLGIARVTAMDGAVGSALFVLFAIVAAPFLMVGRLGVALTSWAPTSVQVIVVGLLAIGTALALDPPLRRALSRYDSRRTR